MPGLGTSQNVSGNNGGGCSNNMLDKFLQLVLAAIVSAFIFLLGILIIDISGKVYTLLNPTQTQSQKVLKAVQSVMSWVLTLIVAITGYLLVLIGVGVLFTYTIIFLIKLVAKTERAKAEVSQAKTSSSKATTAV